MKKKLVCALLIAAGIGCLACSKTDNHSSPVTGTPVDASKNDTIKNTQVLSKGVLHQKGTALKSLCAISGNNLSAEQKVLVAPVPVDPSSASGYTLVFVHTWTKDLASVKKVVDGLNAHVRVVTPDVFVKLVKANLGNK